MSKYFTPVAGEVRICSKVKSGCTPTKITLQDTNTGDLFVSPPGLEYWVKRRKTYIDGYANKLGHFFVRFSVHEKSTNGDIDANEFGHVPYIETI